MRTNSANPGSKKQVRYVVASLLVILSVLTSACAGRAVETEAATGMQDEAMMEDKSGEAMLEVEEHPAPMDDGTEEPMMNDAEDAMMNATEEPMMEATEESMMESGMDDPPSGEEMMAAPDWFLAQMQDVNSGESFSIQDFSGKVILVETMAVWCTTCLQQQRQVEALHEMLGARDDFISLGLDIDPHENADDLKEFIDRHGFDWHYAVASQEVARELSNLYGAQFINPPSAPMLIIDRHGGVHPLPFGVKDAQTLMEALEPHLEESI